MSSSDTSKSIDQPFAKKRRLNPEIYPDSLKPIVSRKQGYWKAAVLVNVATQIGNDPDVGLSAVEFMTAKYFASLLQQPSHLYLGKLLDEIASCPSPERDWQLVSDAILSLILPKPQASGQNNYPSHESIIHYQDATLKSWNYEFVGDAQVALWDHIKRHFKMDATTDIYAYYTSIVQSSGMGKSRVVDELSKRHFVIPINLRGPGTTGYPPRDGDVYSYLTELTSDPPQANYDNVYCRITAFLQALFKHTTETIQSEDFEHVRDDPSATFRKKMTEGQMFDSRNKFRTEFYRNVINQAKAIEQLHQGPPYKLLQPNEIDTCSWPVLRACSTLASFLQPNPSKYREDDGPAFVIVFDEAHILTQQVISIPDSRIASWSPFTVLRRVLCVLNSAPCFSLFLSTTGKLSHFTPSQAEDGSARLLMGELALIPPFTDLGFDTFAQKIAVDGTVDLATVASVEHMAHLGRPLFGSMHDSGAPRIIKFAAQKLLNGSMDKRNLSIHQQLACLSHRIPLELYSTHYTAKSIETQVEGHMRVCLRVVPRFETMETTCPSEPLLSEAAYTIMNHESFDVSKAMESVLNGFAVNQGDRGEFIAMLLLTIARDKAVSANRNSSPIMSLRSFLTEGLWKSPELKEAIQKDFPDSELFFNHFIKLSARAVIRHPWFSLLHTRGAAVQCANGQEAIDGLIFFCPNGRSVGPKNQGYILVQIKNDPHYTDTYSEKAFRPIDPRKLGILSSSDPAVPIIKVFFALAARKPALHFKRFEASPKYNAVVYHIWCAGLSPEFFHVIDQNQADTWAALLKASYGWQKVYRCPDSNEDLRRGQNPGAAYELPHWNSWLEDRSDRKV